MAERPRTFADKMKEQREKKKNGKEDYSPEEHYQRMGLLLDKLMVQAEASIEAGQVKMESMTDIFRLYSASRETNDVQSILSGGGGKGTTPEIDMSQAHVINQVAKDSDDRIIMDEEEETYDVENATEEDVQKLMEELDKEQNRRNEELGS